MGLYAALVTAALLSTAQDVQAAGRALLPPLARFAHHAWAVLLPPVICLVHYAYQLLKLYGAPSLLALEVFLCVALLPWLMGCRGSYGPERPPQTLTREQMRHPAWNVFVAGLSQKGILLRKYTRRLRDNMD